MPIGEHPYVNRIKTMTKTIARIARDVNESNNRKLTSYNVNITKPLPINNPNGFPNPLLYIGDMIIALTNGTPANAERLGIGAEGFVLTVVGGVPVWAASGSGVCAVIGMKQTLTTESGVNLSSVDYIDDLGNVITVDDACLQTASECGNEFDWWNRNRTSRIVIASGMECLLLHDTSHTEGIFTDVYDGANWIREIRDSIIIPGKTVDDEPDGTKLIAVTIETSTVELEGFRLKPISWLDGVSVQLSQFIIQDFLP